MSSRKSARGAAAAGGGDDNNSAPVRKRTLAEKVADAKKWAAEEKKTMEAKAAAAAASGSATAATTTARTTAAAAKVATASKRKRSQPDESSAASAESSADDHGDDSSPVAPRSAKKRRFNDDVVKPARTKAEKMAAIKAEQQALMAAAKKTAAAAAAKPAAASAAAATRARKQQPPTPPIAALAAAAVAAPSPSSSSSVRRPTRPVAAVAASPTVATRGNRGGANSPAVAGSRAPAAAAPVPVAAAAAKSPPRPSTIHEKQYLPFGSPIGQNRAGAAAATGATAVRRGGEDNNTIPVPPRHGDPSTLQQQQQGVVHVANALRSPEQQQQEEPKVDHGSDDDDEAYNSDDSYYDSTDDEDEDLLNAEEEEGVLAAPVAEQPLPVHLPVAAPVVAVKQSWLRFIALGVVVAVFGIVLDLSLASDGDALSVTQQWFRDTVLSRTAKTKSLPPCFADSPSYHYDDQVGQMVLVNGSPNAPYCPHELPCPAGAHCADGSIDACQEFFEVTADGSACRLSAASNQTLNAIVALLQKKSAADMCRNFNPGQSGEMDWSKQYEHNVGVGIFGIPSRRPLFVYNRLVEELAELGTAGVNLKLINVANRTRVEANESPLFVVQEVDSDDGQVVIGLHAEQPVPRSNVCRAKHATTWIFILVIGVCMQLTNFVSGLAMEYYRILCEDPLFVGGATIVIIPLLIYICLEQEKREAQKQRALDIVSIREEVVERLKRLAEQQPAGSYGSADSAAVVDSQSLRDDIVWSRYSMSRALRTRMERELWPHVVADIATDRRILATQRVQNGQRRLYWSWRNVGVGGDFGAAAPVVSPSQEHHVRFQQQQQPQR